MESEKDTGMSHTHTHTHTHTQTHTHSLLTPKHSGSTLDVLDELTALSGEKHHREKEKRT